MSKLATAAKRILVGRPFRSDRLRPMLLPKRIAFPVFASDAMSSVAYAPEEIFIVLSVAGLSAYAFAPWVGLAVAVVMLAVIASYRQNVRAYPSGGGDYEVVTTNLGRHAGLVVGSALLVDYVLTVAVSISAAVANIGSAVPLVAAHRVEFAIAAIVLLTGANLRGVRESGSGFAIPTYAFMIAIFGMLGWGFTRLLVLDEPVRAASADLERSMPVTEQLSGALLAFLLLRSFAQGSAALTGVQAISNGVPAFRKPKSRNAAVVLLLLGLTSVTMLLGLIVLARLTGVVVAQDPQTQLANVPPGYQQHTLVAQLAGAVFDTFPAGQALVIAATALILALAANTAFNAFPVLGSILAQDRFLPRQLHTRGDRLAFSNGILFLAGAAIVLVVIFRASVTQLIQLYVVGVFLSFTLSQLGMVRHWTRLLATETDPAERSQLRRSRAINGFGLSMTGLVLVVVVVTKFLIGAWIAIAAIVAIFGVMTAVRRHYDRVSEELVPRPSDAVLPSRNHAIVLVSTLHLPTLRAVAYARATRPDILEAVTVNVDDTTTRRLVADWEDRNLPVPLKVVESPYREITKPVLDYVKRIRSDNPRNVVTVFIPEYVVGHWWEQILHNQSAFRLKSRLLFEPGVMVTSVPWQLRSSQRVTDREQVMPGAVRRGLDTERPDTDQQ